MLQQLIKYIKICISAVYPFSQRLVQSVNRNFMVEVKLASEFIRACPLQCLEQVGTGGWPQFALAASTATNWFPNGLTQEININFYRINSKLAHYAVTQTVMRPIVRSDLIEPHFPSLFAVVWTWKQWQPAVKYLKKKFVDVAYYIPYYIDYITDVNLGLRTSPLFYHS